MNEFETKIKQIIADLEILVASQVTKDISDMTFWELQIRLQDYKTVLDLYREGQSGFFRKRR